MQIEKDRYGLECFKIQVNTVDELNNRWGVKKTDYLAQEYLNHYYMLRNKSVFGLIILKKNCTVIK